MNHDGKVALTRLKKILGGMGLREAENHLDRLIKKLAIPLEGFVPLSPYETMKYELTSEDEDGNIIITEPPKLNRPNTILRDKGSRGRFAEDPNELSRWYDSIKNLGDSVILIPFDKTELDKNSEILYGLAQIFGMDPPKDYRKLFDHSNLLSGFRDREGDLDTLKGVFPSLWNDISGVLQSKNLEEDEVVYMFYNQENSPIRPGFTKDPFYFAHDLGHSAFDSEDSDFEFKGILRMFLLSVLKLYTVDKEIYVDQTGREVGEDTEGSSQKIITKSALDEIDEEALDEDERYAAEYLAEFFDVTSTQEDIFGDIFADAASGRLTFDDGKIPSYIYIKGKEYDLKPKNRGEASRLLQLCIDRINAYINPKGAQGGFSPGPFSHLRGKVVLQDV